MQNSFNNNIIELHKLLNNNTAKAKFTVISIFASDKRVFSILFFYSPSGLLSNCKLWGSNSHNYDMNQIFILYLGLYLWFLSYPLWLWNDPSDLSTFQINSEIKDLFSPQSHLLPGNRSTQTLNTVTGIKILYPNFNYCIN